MGALTRGSRRNGDKDRVKAVFQRLDDAVDAAATVMMSACDVVVANFNTRYAVVCDPRDHMAMLLMLTLDQYHKILPCSLLFFVRRASLAVRCPQTRLELSVLAVLEINRYDI